MNHSDITRALDVLKGWQILAYHNDDGADEDSHELYWALAIVFKHINRQKAEIERLQEECDEAWRDHADVAIKYDRLFDEAVTLSKRSRAEAIKEFAERLEDRIVHNDEIINRDSWHITSEINDLVKEMERERE